MVGKSLNHYEIIEPLGSGGMGDVYRAHDTTLGRDVAIKVLPEDLADDPDRLARLKREAHLLAALNHPNVATIYGFEESEGTQFLAMELVKGESLEQRLAGGRLPVGEALDICRQIAEALEAAHEEGIIHRDLKPANVLITPEGRAKVLDFGLAKTTEVAESSDINISHSPTLTVAGTQAGVILGTAPYMSPEQVRGKPLDKRADIWAFGCVLYEALIGSRAFNRETVADTLAAILEVDPPWDALPSDTPAVVQALLRRCLRKDSKRRLRDIGDARIEIEEALEEPVGGIVPGVDGGVHAPAWGRVPPWVLVAASLVIAVGAVLWATLSGVSGPLPIVEPEHWRITLPEGKDRFEPGAAISEDGSRVAFVASGLDDAGDRIREIYTQVLGEAEATAVPGTDTLNPDASFNQIFFSPDGKSLGFGARSGLWRVDLDGGGDPLRICDAPTFRGGSWGPDDTIVYSSGSASGLLRISASTVPCDPEQVTEVDPDRVPFASHRFPHYLPGGAVIFTRKTLETGIWGGEIVLLDPETGDQRSLIEGTGAVYVEPGYLVFGHGDALAAAPFDLESQTLGDATPLLTRQEVRFRSPYESHIYFAASRSGHLVHMEARPPRTRTLALSEPGGTPEPIELRPQAPFEYVAGGGSLQLSPDKTQLLTDDKNKIWVHQMNPPGPATSFGFPDSHNFRAIWTPDGESIVFASDYAGTMSIYIQAADGTGDPELLVDASNGIPRAFSADGSILLYEDQGTTTGFDIWIYDRRTEDRRQLTNGPGGEIWGALSPDGRYFAYSQSGGLRVRSIADGRQVESWRGTMPRWGPGNRDLYFRDGDQWFKAPVKEGPELGFGDLERIPPLPIGIIADGRMLTVHSTSPPRTWTELEVVLNFNQELIERVPRGR